MKKKKRKTDTGTEMDGYLVLMEVLPWKRAASVQARQNPRMARDMRTRPQKNANTAPVFGSSLVMMGFPEMAERMFWIKFFGRNFASEDAQ